MRWGVPHDEDYNFFSYFEEEEGVEQSRMEQEIKEPTIPLTSQTANTQGDPSSSSSSESSREKVPHFRSLQNFMR